MPSHVTELTAGPGTGTGDLYIEKNKIKKQVAESSGWIQDSLIRKVLSGAV